MRTAVRAIFSLGFILLTLSSCATMPFGPLRTGEMRLRALEMPELIEEGREYDVVLRFDAGQEESIQVKDVCFQWLVERTSIRSPSLYCYATEVQNDEPIGSVCTRWLDDGLQTRTSAPFCTAVKDRVSAETGRFSVKVPVRGIDKETNKLECQVEYFVNGELKRTNKVSAQVRLGE